MSNLIEKCDEKKRELDSFRPLSPEQEARVLQKFRLDWNYHSNHLEGNSLTYGETRALILHGLTAQGKPLQDHFEITGHNEAILWVEDLVRKKEPLTEHVIRQLHELILKSDHYIDARTADGQPTRLLVEVGKYKTQPNHVQTITGEPLFFSSPADTPADMHALMDWYRSSDDEPILKAAYFHYRFIRIHPFSDGNGRIARLVMNFILMMGGFPPVIIKTDEKDAYFSALRIADAGNVEAFVDYVATHLLRSLALMLKAAHGNRIDEPDDVDKEIALLRQRFSATGRELQVMRNQATLDTIWKDWMKAWFANFVERMVQFETFYLTVLGSIQIDNTTSDLDVHSPLSKLPTSISAKRDSQISVSVHFSALKKIGLEAVNFGSSLTVQFFKTQYRFLRQGSQILGDFAYHEAPTEEQLRDWIAAEMRAHATAIDNQLSKL